MNTRTLISRNKREGRYAGRCQGLQLRTLRDYQVHQVKFPSADLVTMLLFERGFI